MNKIFKTPHLFFFGLVPIFILISFFRSDTSFDFNFQNTYFAIAIPYLCYLSAAFFGLVGINYYVLHWARKAHKKALTSIHITLQIASLLFFIYFMFSIPGNNNSGTAYPSPIDENSLFIVSFALFIIATIVHFVNFIMSLLAKRE
ncbi:hypothetical protein RQM59_06975 [Flavobacteriaceae bacterium S356]|uniref:DUF2975 domain-containing protein n=1 Tax=Asprobacillus argus TaxID=3076534 RepID=A0ABU3LEH9_9FLAO|nr:hypothetical protein [Flavobacteriaceae bacterium S356]